MSETNGTELKQPTEREILRQRADLMGITYSPNIGDDTLRARIEAKLEGKEDPADEPDAPAAEEPNPLGENVPDRPETLQELRARLHKEQLKLVRVRIQNLDPKKKDLPGEIITVGNEILGTVRKFVPYGEVTENGYHIPYIIYTELEARRFLNIRTGKKDGQIQVNQGWAKEFAIEVLPPLTQHELDRLAASQAAGNNIGGDSL